MRLLRSVPAGRAYVVDNIERLIMRDHDYTMLGDIDDDVLQWADSHLRPNVWFGAR